MKPVYLALCALSLAAIACAALKATLNPTSTPTDTPEPTYTSTPTSPSMPTATASSTSTYTSLPTLDPATRKQLMDYLLPNVKHFMGDANAPITLIEFSDFQCSYCGRFATGAWRQINDTYVKNGKVRFGYWHVAFLGEESQWAAEASECAGDQDKFWEYHDKLFASQNGENQGAFSKDNLKKFAADLKLETAAFNECLDSGKYTQAVQEQTAIANQLGVSSTPAFIVNGYPMLGAQPFETFQKLIEGELSATK